MTTEDRIRTRTVQNLLKLIEEHLEAMQRDVHGLEYAHWKEEVDGFWKSIFEQVSLMDRGSAEVGARDDPRGLDFVHHSLRRRYSLTGDHQEHPASSSQGKSKGKIRSP